MVENSHKSIEKLFLKKPPRKQQVNDFYFYLFIFFCTKFILQFDGNELQFEIT